MSEEDIQITIDLLKKVKPHQIYCAGDLADPHGTHKVCLDIVFESMTKTESQWSALGEGLLGMAVQGRLAGMGCQ